jgi:hypothetical protein
MSTDIDIYETATELGKENGKLRTELEAANATVERLIEGLKILEVAVNDKQQDPGAVNFIRKLLDN